MKTSSIAVETSRSISQSDSIVRQTNKRSFLSDTTMNNIHIFNDNSKVSLVPKVLGVEVRCKMTYAQYYCKASTATEGEEIE